MPTSTEITVVTKRGQVSIPARLRKELALVKGRRLRWERVGEHELRLTIIGPAEPRGAEKMRGFARKFHPEARSTAEWMEELREGEEGWPGSSIPAS